MFAIKTTDSLSCALRECWLILLIIIPLITNGIRTEKNVTIAICSTIFKRLNLGNFNITPRQMELTYTQH